MRTEKTRDLGTGEPDLFQEPANPDRIRNRTKIRNRPENRTGMEREGTGKKTDRENRTGRTGPDRNKNRMLDRTGEPDKKQRTGPTGPET